MVTYSWSFRVPRPHLELFFCCVRVCNLFTTAVALSLVSAASAPSPTETIHRALTEGKAPATLGTNSTVPYCAVQKKTKGNRTRTVVRAAACTGWCTTPLRHWHVPLLILEGARETAPSVN